MNQNIHEYLSELEDIPGTACSPLRARERDIISTNLR